MLSYTNSLPHVYSRRRELLKVSCDIQRAMNTVAHGSYAARANEFHSALSDLNVKFSYTFRF